MIKKHGGNVYEFSKTHNIDIDQIIDFSANINPFGLSELIVNQLPHMFGKVLNYPDPNYTDLKQAVSTFENIKEEHIVLGNGAIECIFLLAEHLKAKKILIPAPTFVEYERAFSKYNTEIEILVMKDMVLDIDLLIKNLSDDIDAIIICNPNNPTGGLIPRSQLYKLLEYTHKKGKQLILDEAFIDFTDDEHENTMKYYIEKYQNLTILKSLTKFFAVPGLRLGYLLSSQKVLLNAINNNRMPWSINSIASQVGVLVLQDETYIKKTKSWIRKERSWFLSELLTIEGISPYKSQGNYIFFKSNTIDLDIQLAPFGIMIRNCNNYEGLTDGYFRVAIKDREKNIKLILCIKEILWKS